MVARPRKSTPGRRQPFKLLPARCSKMNSVAARTIVSARARRLLAAAHVRALQIAHSRAARLVERARGLAGARALSAAARLSAGRVFRAIERARSGSADQRADRAVVAGGRAVVAAGARERARGPCSAQAVVRRRAGVGGGPGCVDAGVATRCRASAAAASSRSERKRNRDPKARALHARFILDARRSQRTRLPRIYRIFTEPNRRADFSWRRAQSRRCFAPRLAQSRRYIVTTHAPPRPRLC